MNYEGLYNSLHENGYGLNVGRRPGLQLAVDLYRDDDTVIDVGCGVGIVMGRFVVAAGRETTPDIHGIDVSPEAVRLAQEKWSAQWGDLTKELPVDDDEADLTICFHVLEHLTQDDANHALQELIRITKRDLVLEIPAEKDGSGGTRRAHLLGYELEDLHLTQQGIRWWYNRLIEADTDTKIEAAEVTGLRVIHATMKG